MNSIQRIVICLAIIAAMVQSQNFTLKTAKFNTIMSALQPKGLRARIYVEADISFLFFEGYLFNDFKELFDIKSILYETRGAATKQVKGGWLFEDPDIVLQVGQVIAYAFYVSDQNAMESKQEENLLFMLNGTTTDIHIFDITELVDPDASPTCTPTVTKVRGKRMCSGDIIFEDNFDKLQEDLWQIEQYIPTDHPEYPFVSYQRLPTNVFVQNGLLFIIPQLQENLLKDKNESILTGTLDLGNGCTRSSCSIKADGAYILPPIVSGRLTSVPFAFKYGEIRIRAMLPQGDWIYPEILLESMFRKYGNQKDLSRILKVAMAGGNRKSDYNDGNKYLKGRLLTNQSCLNYWRFQPTPLNNVFWGDGFHEYGLRWTPDNIAFIKDDFQYISYERKDLERTLLCLGEDPDIDAFYDYLHIVLGVAVGGIVEFPDEYTVSVNATEKLKPWRNWDHKASYKFWKERDSWYPTWTDRRSLVIDYVKVIAI